MGGRACVLVGWQLNASARILGGGGGEGGWVLRAYSLARFPKNKQSNKQSTRSPSSLSK